MSKSKNFKQRWLPLALVPLFSVSVLAGCGSDDDDDGDSGGDPVTEEGDMDTEVTDTGIIVGDTDGDGVPDAFQTTDATADADGNGIADVFQTAADGSTTDENGNAVDDSFEVALTEGADANADGVDDEAGADLIPVGGDTDGGDPDGGMMEVVDQTGPLTVPLNDAGTANLSWDGFNLTGQIDVDGLPDGVGPARADLYTGIQASGNGVPIASFNGNGNPTFFLPMPLSPDQSAAVAENIVSGNLYVQVDLSDGSSRPGIILLPQIQPKFSGLSAENSVPPGEANSNGSGFINLNTVTGDFSAVVNVNLDASDVDAEGVPETVTAVHIHEGAADEEGPVLIPFEDSGNGLTWTAKGQFSAEQLEAVIAGGTYFNVHRTDTTNFMRGQIAAF